MNRSLTPALLLPLLLGCTGRSAQPESGKPAPTEAHAPTAAAVPAPAGTPSANGDADRGTTREVPFLRNDTLFFYDYSHRDTASGFLDFCRVFVDKNRLSANYSRIQELAAPDSERNRRDFEELTAALRTEYPGAIRRHDLRGCPGTWLQLASVDGEYYLDELYMYPITITDSLFVEQMQDGPWPSLLDTFECPAPGHYRFRTRGLRGEKRSFDLYLTDTLRRVAVLAEHEGEATRYQLLAAGEFPPQFDLLVWESSELSTGDEVRRDAPDFEAMIAGR
ncbi:MAG: hypothetical protein K2I59_07995 [Alistipes sp.]|nr:hypothetical protein [Alistipes sp.]